MRTLSELWSDLRQAGRGLRQKPGFTLVVLFSLALGVGANTAIFSVVDGVLLRPLPFKDSARLVAIQENQQRFSLKEMHISPTVGFMHRREQLHSFTDILGMDNAGYQLIGAKEPEQLEAGEITANFCSVLGVQPIVGRCFGAEETAHHDLVAILSYGVWQRQFDADPNILGRAVTLKHASDVKRFTVVGVLPAQFRLGVKLDIWTPITRSAEQGPSSWTVGRLMPGVTVKQARAELLAMQRQMFPNEYDGAGGVQIVVEPLADLMTGAVKPGLTILFAAVGLVLLITCANVANLLLGRGTMRARETAVRASLGASRWRLCRQLLTESLSLALLGGAAGWLTGYWILEGIKLLAASRLPRLEEVSMNASVLGYTAAVAILTGVLTGVLPGLRLSRVDLATAMKSGGNTSTAGRNQQRTMNALVVFEVAVCIVSLMGAGLLVNTLIRLERVDTGFRPDNVLIASLSEPSGEAAAAFYTAVLERVQSMPQVEAAGITENPPPYHVTQIQDFLLPGQTTGHGARANSRVVSPGYFQALGIPLVSGRVFNGTDNANSARVVVISESMARRLWPGRDAVGQTLLMGRYRKETPHYIIGVVGDVRQTGLRRVPDDQLYSVYAQTGELPGLPTLVARTKTDPAAFAATLRDAIRWVDPDQPVNLLKTMDQLMEDEVADPRFYMILLSSFAALALALTVTGVAGVVAYSAGRRTREMGLRICFGATRPNLLSLFAWDNAKLVAAGVALGALVSLAVTRFAKSLLFEVTPTDPTTFAAVASALTGASLVACYLVALRTTAVDPVAVLRDE